MTALILDRFEVQLPSFGSRDFSLTADVAEENPASASSLPGGNDVEGETEDRAEAESDSQLVAAQELEQIIANIWSDWEKNNASSIRHIADAAGRSVAAMLPNLVDNFGCRQLSASVVAILERAKPEAPELLLAPESHDSIVEILSDINSQIPLKVRKSTENPPGKASLRWNLGGADIDMADLLCAAQALLERDQTDEINGAPEQ